MNIKKIKIKNYRLLKDFELDIEPNLSLVIGKNNTGKTSLLSILDKFIGDRSQKNEFSFEDFNIDFKNELKKVVEDLTITEENYHFLGISMRLFINYDEADDLSNISNFMMDLDPDNKTVVLNFEYLLPYTGYRQLVSEFKDFKEKELVKKTKKLLALKAKGEDVLETSLTATKIPAEVATTSAATTRQNNNEDEETKKLIEEEYKTKDICYFLKLHHDKYFSKFIKTLEYNIDDLANPYVDESKFIDITKDKAQLNKIICFKIIGAKRDVSNKDPDRSLSSLSSKIYKKAEESENEIQAIEDFKDALSDTDDQLDGIYKNLFSAVISKVKKFGGVQQGDSVIEIISTLKHKELLEGNTTVMYKHNDDDSLPEHYNGLGYMNLISMIFEIEILLHHFRKDKTEKPADINLLFIEEPEAHTHPQMQYVFIKNIKALLENGIVREDGINRKLQTIISTHSSHIVSESDFDDIKYFKKIDKSVVSKNLKDLIKEYEVDPKEYKFLKQYLTISRAELFFADKAILIEGDTEIILLPTMMKKFDLEEERYYKSQGTVDEELPLLSQNISIIEVGAYSQIFEKFISFLGIKSLIITDLDSVGADNKACRVSSGVSYSNTALSFFFGSATTLANLISYTLNQKTFEKNNTWIRSATGPLCIVYQNFENGYTARSFEDAFIHLNKVWISANIGSFRGIKNKRHFNDMTKDSYDLAELCINKKTHFALDILYNSDELFSNWQIPLYIKEGLQWLKKS